MEDDRPWDGDGLACWRAAAFVGAVLPGIAPLGDPRLPSTWAALTRACDRHPMSGFLLAGPCEAVERSLAAGETPYLDAVYGEAEEAWSIQEESVRDRSFAEHEARRRKLDDAVAAALAAAVPSPRDVGRQLVAALRPDLGRSTASWSDPAEKLARKLVRRSLALDLDPVRQARIDLGWTVLAPLRGWRDPQLATLASDLAGRALALFRAGLPPGLAEPAQPVGVLSGAELLWPVVRRSQLPNWRGLRFDWPEVRRCFASRGEERGAVLVGVAQLAHDPAAFGIVEREALHAALRVLAERLPAVRPLLTEDHHRALKACEPLPSWLAEVVAACGAAGSRPAAPRAPRTRPAPAPPGDPVVDGLRGGALLWPLLALIRDPSWVAWRSDPPAAAALMKAGKEHALDVRAGIDQLLADPAAFGFTDPERQLALRRTLGVFAVKRRRWLGR